jgi:hypothetical protein
MPRTEIGKVMEKKLNKWFAMTLDTDNDGLVKWSDFELAVEVTNIFFFFSRRLFS